MRASARSLHLYAPAVVSRRPSREATDADAPPARTRALRQVAAAVIRCALPSAARWRCLPAPAGRISFSSLPADWRTPAEDALRASRRGDVDAAGTAAAALSELVEQGRLPLAAAMLAEAAALCNLDDATRALRVATLAVARSDHRAAEWWGRRAARLAARSDRWNIAVSAWARVSTALCERSRYKAAVVAVRHEVRAAKRAQSRDQYARALHSLFVTYAAAGDYGRAAKSAARALRAYSTGHPQLFAFAYDLARFHIDRGSPAAARPPLQNLVSFARTPQEILLVVASTAEAASVVGNRELLHRALTDAEAIVRIVEHGNGYPWALATLAAAALDGAGDFERAQAWAAEALVLAEKRDEHESAVTARRVLDACWDQF